MFTNGLPVLYYLNVGPLIKIRNVSKAMRKRATHIFRNSQTIFDPCSTYFYLTSASKSLSNNTQQMRKAKQILKGPDSIKTVNLTEDEEILNDFCDKNEISLFEVLSILWDKKYNQYVENSTNTSSFDDSQRRLYKKFAEIDRDSFHKTLKDNAFSYHIDVFRDEIKLDEGFSRFLDVITIGTAKKICFPSFAIYEIVSKLNRINMVDSVTMEYRFHDLSKVNWFKSIKKLVLKGLSIEKEIELPNLKHLEITGVHWNKKEFSKIKCNKVESFATDNINVALIKLAALKKLKVFEYSGTNFNDLIQYLPNNLRDIIIGFYYPTDPINTKAVIEQCPNLVKFTSTSGRRLKIDDLIGSKIKEAFLSDEFDSVEEYPIRFNQILIDDNNYKLIHNHPEIISECSRIIADSQEFDFKYLPDNLKFFESSIINAINKETVEKCLYKFKNCEISCISVERLEYIEKLLQVTNKVERIMYCDKEKGEKKYMFKPSKRGKYYHWEISGSDLKFIGEKSLEELKRNCHKAI